eukprot:Protomagalhaensia_sp_Gyna_25__1138@NODE_1559_length_1731_cov_245_676123_g1266_i0_p1_GENE_NODE_1559_length_1731_cov_245_676123_g1266_i0NODE_1559_length_1731_cov_245_676123_g1266_i0_p1_ORF_typecomplete_len393_score65_52DUF2478/PF10649_9/0_27DUF2478/PF10649_9/2_8e02DUF2478/PF10649_9/3_5e03_NODE_1559_length_1731_cov_245_676123_g1266_i05521685
MQSGSVVEAALAIKIPALVSAVPLVTLEDWFTVAEGLLEPLPLSPETMLQVLTPKLFPEAQALIYRAGVYDWQTAKALLRDVCGARVYAQKASFLNPRQTADETAAAFGQRLGQTPFGLSGTLTGKIPEPHVAALFVSGLENMELRAHLISLAPQSLQRAISLASEWEAARGEAREDGSHRARDLISEKKREFLSSHEVTAGGKKESSLQGQDVSAAVKMSDDACGQCAGTTQEDSETYTLDADVLGQYLCRIRAARKRRTVQDVRRLCALSHSSMSLAERKVALDTPHDDKARIRLHMELILPLPSGLLCTTKRPTISHVWRLQKLGRYLCSKNGGKPVLAPGRWAARLCGWDLAAPSSASMASSADVENASEEHC